MKTSLSNPVITVRKMECFYYLSTISDLDIICICLQGHISEKIKKIIFRECKPAQKTTLLELQIKQLSNGA